jgi:hypothetical protein
MRGSVSNGFRGSICVDFPVNRFVKGCEEKLGEENEIIDKIGKRKLIILNKNIINIK